MITPMDEIIIFHLLTMKEKNRSNSSTWTPTPHHSTEWSYLATPVTNLWIVTEGKDTPLRHRGNILKPVRGENQHMIPQMPKTI